MRGTCRRTIISVPQKTRAGKTSFFKSFFNLCYTVSMSFIYEKIETGGQAGIEILGYEGTVRKLTVPETIEGLPVLSIGRHAFTDKNTGIEEITLPKTVRCIRAFAFYFCSDLRRLILWDSVDDYYDGAIRTSAGLCDIELEMRENRYELVRRILEDSDRKLRVLFRFPDYALQLVFPDYNNNSVEDTRAQTFHIHIEGSGFSYRECVRNNGIRIREYDSLYRRALSADNLRISIEIAVGRLMYPAELTEASADAYRAHIRSAMDTALELSMQPENADWLELFMREELLDEAGLDKALKLVSERRMTAMTGLLMDYRRRKLKPGTKSRLSLDGLF